VNKLRNAIVLLSGGLDSSTVLAMASDGGRKCLALSFRYGQKHAIELHYAALQARRWGVEHLILDIPTIAGSSLTDGAVQENGANSDTASVIPQSYVPARNTVFLSIALGLAEVHNADIWVGVNAVDYSGYPDCRPEYIHAFQRMADLATRAGIEGCGPKVIAPLLHLSKTEIVAKGLALGVDYSLTSSCYAPIKGVACHACDSCGIRDAAFASI
jgi:7-cyano-7-deazaguanine synthase